MLKYDAEKYYWAAGRCGEFKGKEIQLHMGGSDVSTLTYWSRRAAGYRLIVASGSVLL